MTTVTRRSVRTCLLLPGLACKTPFWAPSIISLSSPFWAPLTITYQSVPTSLFKDQYQASPIIQSTLVHNHSQKNHSESSWTNIKDTVFWFFSSVKEENALPTCFWQRWHWLALKDECVCHSLKITFNSLADKSSGRTIKCYQDYQLLSPVTIRARLTFKRLVMIII